MQSHARGCLYDNAVITLRTLEASLNLLDHTLATATIATTNEHGCRSSILAPGVVQGVKMLTEVILKIQGAGAAEQAGKRSSIGGKTKQTLKTERVTEIPRMFSAKRQGLTAASVTQTTTTTTTRAVMERPAAAAAPARQAFM